MKATSTMLLWAMMNVVIPWIQSKPSVSLAVGRGAAEGLGSRNSPTLISKVELVTKVIKKNEK